MYVRTFSDSPLLQGSLTARKHSSPLELRKIKIKLYGSVSTVPRLS